METAQDPKDEMEVDLVRVINSHQRRLDEHRRARDQRRLGVTPLEVPPEENKGDSRPIK